MQRSDVALGIAGYNPVAAPLHNPKLRKHLLDFQNGFRLNQIGVPNQQRVGFNRLAVVYQMGVELALAPEVHVSETKHPAQVAVGIIEHRIAVAYQSVGNFNRKTVLKTAL